MDSLNGSEADKGKLKSLLLSALDLLISSEETNELKECNRGCSTKSRKQQDTGIS